MDKKYKLLEDDFIKLPGGTKLYRIQALKDFGDVKEGNKGGYIQSKKNLSQEGKCWVYGSAMVFGSARVYGSAEVCGSAVVYGSAEVFGSAMVYGSAEVCGSAVVSDKSDIVVLQGFGSEYRATTAFRLQDGGIGVKRGCFYGTQDEFKKQVEQTHGDNKFGKEYKLVAELIRLHFEEEEPCDTQTERD